jgi:hypothetical protein
VTFIKTLKKIFKRNPPGALFSHYFALGDSISTDDYPGAQKGAASLLHNNIDQLYPEFGGKDLCSISQGIDFQCLARDGATSHDVLHGQLLRLPPGSASHCLFTLTAGGNDILSMQSDPEEIVFRLQTILNHIKRNFPNSPILLGTIYDPSDGTAELFDDEIPLTRELDTLQKTNHAIRSMKEPGRVYIADIYQHFLGHGTKAKDVQNDYHQQRDPSLWYVMTIEPNSRGAHEIRRLFWQSLNEYFQDQESK